MNKVLHLYILFIIYTYTKNYTYIYYIKLKKHKNYPVWLFFNPHEEREEDVSTSSNLTQISFSTNE